MSVNLFFTLEHTFNSDGFILQFYRISMNSAQNGGVLQNKKKVITYIAAAFVVSSGRNHHRTRVRLHNTDACWNKRLCTVVVAMLAD